MDPMILGEKSMQRIGWMEKCDEGIVIVAVRIEKCDEQSEKFVGRIDIFARPSCTGMSRRDVGDERVRSWG